MATAMIAHCDRGACRSGLAPADGWARLVRAGAELHGLWDGAVHGTCASDCTEPVSWTVEAIDEPVGSDPLFAVGADGSLHLLADGGAYAICPDGSDCATRSGWLTAQIPGWESERVGGMETDATGAVHAVASAPSAGSPAGAAYALCTGDCFTSASWRGLELDATALMPEGLAVAAPDHVGIAFGQTLFAECRGDCGDPAAWTVGSIGSSAGTYNLRAFPGSDGGFRIAGYRVESEDEDPDYWVGHCGMQCTEAGSWNWRRAHIPFLRWDDSTTIVGMDGNGLATAEVRCAENQGHYCDEEWFRLRAWTLDPGCDP